MGRLRDRIVGELQQAPRSNAHQLIFTKGLLGGFVAGAVLAAVAMYTGQLVKENERLRTATEAQYQDQRIQYVPANLTLPPPFEETNYGETNSAGI